MTSVTTRWRSLTFGGLLALASSAGPGDLTVPTAGGSSNHELQRSAYTARCSGYVATAQYEAGLAYCNRALELYEAIWRKRQNNAAARLGSGQIAVA